MVSAEGLNRHLRTAVIGHKKNMVQGRRSNPATGSPDIHKLLRIGLTASARNNDHVLDPLGKVCYQPARFLFTLLESGSNNENVLLN